MEALLQSLATRYGMEKAMQLLGIDKQEANPKYAISLGGRSINPMNMLKRAGLNRGIKSLTGGKLGGMLGPAVLMGGALGLGYLTNPLRPGSYNYNPELQGQIDYLSGKDGMIGRNTNSGLMQYGPNSVLSGQGVVSGFGTNDYGKQLQNKADKLNAIKKRGYNTIFGKKSTDFTEGQQKELDKTNAELENLTTDEFDRVDAFMDKQKSKNKSSYQGPGNIHGNGGNSGGGGGSPGSAGPGGSDAMGSFRRGGIASL